MEKQAEEQLSETTKQQKKHSFIEKLKSQIKVKRIIHLGGLKKPKQVKKKV